MSPVGSTFTLSSVYVDVLYYCYILYLHYGMIHNNNIAPKQLKVDQRLVGKAINQLKLISL
jgi:hypothetical protein